MGNKVCAVILAGGSGSRMNSDVTKQRILIRGKSVLAHTVSAFDACADIDSIIIVAREDELDFARAECSASKKVVAVVKGGNDRAESARNGFYAISADVDFVAIHDAARCLVAPDDITRVVEAAKKHGAATAVMPVSDTVKLIDNNSCISNTVDRDTVRLAATPQIFRTDIYSEALKIAARDEICVTDDNMLVEHAGYRIFCVDTGRNNIKITQSRDLEYAEFVLNGREQMSGFRIGHGYDVHKLVADRPLIIGGVEIPHTLGLLGHSDADVLLHAIMDAIIGAMGLGDIGRHFPDTDEKYRGISSLKLLSHVAELMRDGGYTLVNLDATVVAQRPKLLPHISKMCENISKTLGCDASIINVKATTEERLGFTGREEGISSHAVALIEKK